MKNIVRYLIAFVSAIVLLASCISKYVESDASKIATADETAILNYTTKNKLTVLKNEASGIYYRKLVTNDAGTPPANQYLIHVAYKISTLNDSVLISKSVADSAIFNVYSSSVFSGFTTALSLLKEGEKGQFFLPSAVAYGSNPPAGLAVNTPIILEIQMVHLISESEQINKYIAKKGLTVTEKTSDSLRFIRTSAILTGDSLKAGDVVAVKYNGMYLSETSFDSGTFNYTIASNTVVAGFAEGVGKLKKGEKARLIFPSSIGYGATGSSPKILPYTPLIFDIEIVSVNGL